MQAELKGRGHVLMTKFGMAEKTGLPVCQTGVSDFDSFRAKPR
jgi:hypothetical protein